MADFSEFGDIERRAWADGDIVDAYNVHFGALADQAAETLLEMAEVGEGTELLDLCCGGGGLSAAALACKAKVNGLDFSPQMIARARRRAPDAHLLEGDAQSLPFEANSFDTVLSNFGIQHTPDHDRAYAEVLRVLRPGGAFAMTCWDACNPEGAFGLMMLILKQNVSFISPPPPQPGLFDLADEDAAERTMMKHGLTLVEHRILPLRWHLEAPEQLFERFAHGTVGVRMLIEGQRGEAIRRISAAAAREVEARFATPGGFEVPVPAAALLARKM